MKSVYERRTLQIHDRDFKLDNRRMPHRKWQPTPIFLPGKLHGLRTPAIYSSWGHKRVRHDPRAAYPRAAVLYAGLWSKRETGAKS